MFQNFSELDVEQERSRSLKNVTPLISALLCAVLQRWSLSNLLVGYPAG